MTPEILFLTHRIPYPPDKGDKIRSWRILKLLCERYRVHLACFADDPRDIIHKEFLESLCESVTIISIKPHLARLKSLKNLFTGAPLSFGYFQNAKMTTAVKALRSKPLTAEIAFSSSMSPYIKKPTEGRKRIIDFCDTDAEKWRDYGQATQGPMKLIYAREAKSLARAESEIANWADASFAISAEEADIFNRRTSLNRKVQWFSNGVDARYFDPLALNISNAPHHNCVFTGAMDYRANVEGVLHFIKFVWPKVRKAKPDASFAIVGANPAPAIKALDGTEGVTVTGRVEDIRPWLAGANIVVAPLRVARGVQNKVLEAMAMAKQTAGRQSAVTDVQRIEITTVLFIPM